MWYRVQGKYSERIQRTNTGTNIILPSADQILNLLQTPVQPQQNKGQWYLVTMLKYTSMQDSISQRPHISEKKKKKDYFFPPQLWQGLHAWHGVKTLAAPDDYSDSECRTDVSLGIAVAIGIFSGFLHVNCAEHPIVFAGWCCQNKVYFVFMVVFSAFVPISMVSRAFFRGLLQGPL